VSHQTQDEAFHEIQLNGKQLVFLFMAATVVSVVIFLCGVLVGRGARVDRAAPDGAVAAGEASPVPAAEPVPQPQPAPATAAAPAASDPTTAQAPPPTTDEVSYPDRLQDKKAPREQLKPPAPIAARGPAPAPAAQHAGAVEAPPPMAPAPAKAPAEAVPAASSEPGGAGFAVQIAALNIRSEADAIARRLSAKGYAVYVLTPPAGSPSVFRVRVGKFKTHREAETVAAKLQKEEQFTPWITR